MNRGMYKKTRDSKKRKKRFFTFIALLVFVAVGIVAAQVIINKKNSKSEKTMQVEAKAKEAQTDTKKEDKQEEQAKKEAEKKETEKTAVLNTSKEGQAFQDEGLIAQDVSQYKGKRDGKKIAYLTFDDGPSTTVTPKILATLKENEVKATFFIVGNAIDKGEKAKELLKEEYESGQSIAIHSYSHNYDILYPKRQINADVVMGEFDKTLGIMKSVLGEEFNTNVFRFPGGIDSWKNKEPIKEKLKERGISHIEWNALSGDAEGKKRDANGLFNRFKDTLNGQEKVVILMHDTYGKETTAQALPQIIKYLKDNGYEFRTIK